MTVFSSVRDYWRIAAGVRDYARQPVPSDAKGLVRRQVEARETTWLGLVAETVFATPDNPYRRMFELAGCTFGDLEINALRDGLEPTLEKLYDAGVYLTFDEFKGKTPIVRYGEEIPGTLADFRNKLETSWLEGSTSGSSGGRTNVPHGTGTGLLRDTVTALAIEDFNLASYRRLIVRPVLPSAIGVLLGLSMSRLGCPMHEWHATGSSGRDSLHYRLLTRYLTRASRGNNVGIPTPRYLRQGDFTTPTEWIARQKEAGSPSMVSAFVSPAVRMAALATERGWDISGSIFFSGGEVLTPAKTAVLQAAGASVSSRYWVSELGPIGIACSHRLNQDRMHLLHHTVAAIQRDVPAPFGQGNVTAGLLTSVSPWCPSILINAEMGDSFRIKRSSCDCVFGQAGLAWEVSEVSSYTKLTGQGMTLVGNDIIAVLEERLPQLFGGGPGDYQLVERQGDTQTELELRVSPRAGASNLPQVRSELIRELRTVYGGSLATRVWEHSGGLSVAEKEPFATETGKVPPLHLDRTPAQNSRTDES